MPLSPPSTSLSSPPLPRAPPPPLPLARRRSTPSKRVHFPLHLDSTLDQLLQPSPFHPYPSIRPALLPREKSRENAAPPRFLARPPAPTQHRKTAKDDEEPVLSTANLPVSSKTAQAAVQTSPALARSPRSVKDASPPPLNPSPTGFIATLRDSSNSSGSESSRREKPGTRSPFSSSSSGGLSSKSRSTPPSSASSDHKASPRSSCPPYPAAPHAPAAAAQAPLPRPPLAPPPPAARPRSAAAFPAVASPSSPSPRSPSPSPFSTADLAPFRLALDSGGKKSRRNGGGSRAGSETWVELLPPADGGRGGDVVLDARAKGEGEVWVVSGDGETVTLFHSPPSPPSTTTPLILLNPLRTFPYAVLFPPASSPTPHGDDPVNDGLRRARKAWRTVEKVVRVVRSRTVLLTFHPPPSALPSLPSSSSASRIRLLPTPQPKIIVFSDPPSVRTSYSVSLSLALSTSGREVRLGVYVSPARDLVAVSVSSTFDAAASEDGEADQARTQRWTARLSSHSSSSPARSLTDFLSSSSVVFPSQPAFASPDSTADAAAISELDELVLALANPAGETARLVGRVRAAHLSALNELAGEVLSEPVVEEEEEEVDVEEEDKGGREETVETQLARLLSHFLSLPLPPPPLSAPTELGSPAARQGEDGDARCLPGLGWIVRRRLGPEKGQDGEGERGRKYDVLFADGERVVLHAFVGEREGEEEERERVERVEVEDWKGRRYTPFTSSVPSAARPNESSSPPTALPTKLRRRLPPVVELLGLYG